MGTGAVAGQVAVITGAGRGLGEAYAKAFAAEGAAVVVNDIDGVSAERVAAAIVAGGGRAAAAPGAVGTEDAADALVARAVDAFGGIDVMITNAGADRRGSVFELTAGDWTFTLQTHLFGTIHCAIAAAGRMREQGRGGSIITVVSDAFHMGLEGLGPYGTAKGGIYGFTRTLALELAHHGISVNAVAPPMTRTPPVDEFLQSRVEAGAPEGELEFFRSTIQEPDEVALVTVFLASEHGRALRGEVLTMTRDSLAVLRPVGARTTHTDAAWTVEGMAAAVADLTAASGA
jgi:NAD(P)-dependent dehydrogenase (short-subunit alcohol dehydrogenase family)